MIRALQVVAASLLLSLLLSLLCPVAQARTVKLAVVIGNNRGHDPARTLRFAQSDARKLHRVLVQLGDFDAEHSALVLGGSASQAWRALRRVERRIRALGRSPGTRTILVVYYSGHADGNVLELGATSLQFSRLTGLLRSSKADVRLAFVDSCRSGRLVAAKGGRRARGYRIQVADEVASLGYAVITSSAADELSQESAEIRGSFFTHYLVSALRGAGDQSGDGKITLGETYRYTYNRTVAHTSHTVGGSQHPMYDFKLVGQGDIVLTRTRGRRTTLTVAGRGSARIVVLDARAEAMIAEARVKAGGATQLALAPGTYQVFLLSKGGAYRARVRLGSGERRRLDADEFVRHQLRQGLAKGGIFRRQLHHQLSAGFLVRKMPLEGGTATLGAGLQYSLELWPGWRLLSRVSWSSAPDVGLSTGYNDLGAAVGLGYRYLFFTTPLHAGLLLGYEHLIQSERGDASRHSSGFGWLLNVGLDLPVMHQFMITLDGGVGGRVFRLRDSGTTHRLDVQGLIGLGTRWGG